MVCSLLWVAVGYTLVFSDDGALISNLYRMLLRRIAMDMVAPQTWIPEMLFMLYHIR